jgi:hypothetical protein
VGGTDVEEGPSGVPGSRGEGLVAGKSSPAAAVERCSAGGRTRAAGRLARPPPLLRWRARRQARGHRCLIRWGSADGEEGSHRGEG